MKNLKLSLLALAIAALLPACAHLDSVSITQVPRDRTAPISAESSSWGLFGIYFSNGFVDEAVDQLKDKCPGGKISGVYTKYEGRFYFLWTTRTVKATAFCQRAGSKGAQL